MPRFAANLSMMFNEVPFLDRFAAAARAGFQAVEFLFPYEYPAAELRRRLDDNGLQQALFNAPPGDWAGGERGLASLPGRQRDFRDAIARALDYAAALDSPLVHVMAGIPPAGTAPATAAAVYAANLAWAAEQAASAGRRLVIEPINHRDMPGYHLNTTGQAAAIIAAIGAAHLGLQFDIYHCQITEGDVSKRLEALMPITGHIQIADVPARNEPGTGELNWAYLFPRIDALGYAGWIGCEYRPAGETVAGLGWRKTYGV
ncbi:MAG: TIM barrel protein [Rhodospirillales bacterium]|nr:TIM barrel protein [Rhodospirillales bacterium]